MGVLSHGLQGVHNVWLVSLAIEFLLHLGHSIVPALAEARPGGHSMQFTEPAVHAGMQFPAIKDARCCSLGVHSGRQQ